MGVVVAIVLFALTPNAQIGRIAGQDWTTANVDAQRTSWIRSDAFISKDSMTKPEFTLQWTVKLDNVARQTMALTSPATVTVSLMFKPLTVIGGSSDTVYAIDNETGVLYWQTHFDTSPLANASLSCPGGMTAGIGRATPLVFAQPAGRGGFGAGGRGPFVSGVGQPGEGVPAELMSGGMFGPGGGRGPGGPGGAAPGAPGGRGTADAPGRGAQPAAPGGRGGADAAAGRGFGGPGGPGGGRGGPVAVYAVSSDGVLRTLGANSGKEVQQPLPFVPANARVSDVIVVENMAYVATSHACGGAPNGVWAMDLASERKTVASWKTGEASPAGSPAFATNGDVFVAVGSGPAASPAIASANAIVALDPKTLAVKDWFTQAGADFVSSPVVFMHKGKEIVAAATRDGRIVVLDAAALGGVDHTTALHVSAPIAKRPLEPMSIATWEEAGGTRWLVVPSDSAIHSLKLADEGGGLTLQSGWSKALMSRGAPVVVNGVVFAASTSRPAIVYALDASSGKELWNSGKTMTSFVTTGGLWTSAGQVHVATYDGTIYTFGFPLERY